MQRALGIAAREGEPGEQQSPLLCAALEHPERDVKLRWCGSQPAPFAAVAKQDQYLLQWIPVVQGLGSLYYIRVCLLVNLSV